MTAALADRLRRWLDRCGLLELAVLEQLGPSTSRSGSHCSQRGNHQARWSNSVIPKSGPASSATETFVHHLREGLRMGGQAEADGEQPQGPPRIHRRSG
jgi:hypothetical protein